MLKFIKGDSGTGKSTYIINLLADMVKNGEDKILFIVPDQSSFETEKTFLQLLGPMESLKIKVLGFTRICQHIFSVNGNSGKKPLDDGGKAILMSLAIKECQDNIPLFSHTKNKNELVNLMLSAVSEYKICSITTENVLDTAKNISDDTLKEKLIETALLKDTFDALVNDSYIDPDEFISIALNSLRENNIFKDYIIALDSFSGFTNLELEFLEKLMTDSKDFYITLTTDNTNNNELFFTTQRTYRQLSDIARNNGVKISVPTLLDSPVRFKNPDLVPVLRNVFRIDKEIMNYEQKGIFIYESQNKYCECDFVSRNIKKLIIENDYTYDDIAVVYRDDNTYDGIIDTVFEKYEIPFFMDKSEDIFTKPLIKLVSSIFDTVNSSFRRENVLNIMKSGLLSYSSEDISQFENYLYIWDIKGSNFLDDFTENPRGFVSETTEKDIENLKKLNDIRKALITPLVKFRKDCRDTTAENITKNLYNLLLKYNITENIVSLCEKMEKDGSLDLSNELRRLWDILMNVLDKMISLLGNRKITIKDYSQLLILQFNNSDIGFIPRAMDQVVVSGIERVRLAQKKAIFVIGCNEGEFPKVPNSGGVFTDSERKLLIESGMEINDSVDFLNFKEMYLAYYALTLPSERLFVSYTCSNLTGESKTASSIVRELSEIYPKIKIDSDINITADDRLWCDNSAFQYMAGTIKAKSITKDKLLKYFSSKEKYKDKAENLEKILEEKPARITDKEKAISLFGKDLKLSASQVEAFHLCKFKYFCQYGLNAKERRPAEIDSLQYGTLMHYLLERFLKENKKSQYTSYSKEEIAHIVSVYLDEYAKKELGGIDNKSKRFKYLFYRMKNNAINLIIHIVKELSQSDFTPTAFELGLGKDIPTYDLTLDDGSILSIRGFVDRADVMKKNGITYVRIIDYKTGTKVFKLSDVLYGLNLQMLIYLSAISKNGDSYFGDNIVPCGVLYQPSSASYISAGRNEDTADIEKNRNKALKMNGLILDNESVIIGMDKSSSGIFIPSYYNKKGKLNGSEYVANLTQMGKLFKNIDNILLKMADDLHNGKIEYNPAKNNYDACKYCPYISVCGYQEGKNCRDISVLKKDEVFKVLEELESSENHKEQKEG